MSEEGEGHFCYPITRGSLKRRASGCIGREAGPSLQTRGERTSCLCYKKLNPPGTDSETKRINFSGEGGKDKRFHLRAPSRKKGVKENDAVLRYSFETTLLTAMRRSARREAAKQDVTKHKARGPERWFHPKARKGTIL